ncbi:hypothetical protein PLICRDRAFT_249673 [Plicaturopsis crispa FD-325 SS-3]|nr:hypothetical protein PLICRDRAFT_249673 [Plicaturopsis crispa FD-325 SS-3]
MPTNARCPPLTFGCNFVSMACASCPSLKRVDGQTVCDDLSNAHGYTLSICESIRLPPDAIPKFRVVGSPFSRSPNPTIGRRILPCASRPHLTSESSPRRSPRR